MKIDKQRIMDMINSNDEPGNADQADQADRELPQQVDTDKQEHQNLLQKFGIEPQQLLSKFGGGGGLNI